MLKLSHNIPLETCKLLNLGKEIALLNDIFMDFEKI